MPQQTDHNGMFIEGMTDPEELRRFLGIKFSPNEIQSAYEALLEASRQKARAEKTSALRAFWSLLEESFQTRSEGLKCGRGCAFCCHTGVAATQLEWEGILDAVKEKGIDLDEMIARSQKSIDRFRQAQKSDKELAQADWHQLVMNQPCPFLDAEHACMIYEDRPLDCRWVVSFRDVCQSKKLEHAQRGVFLEEAVATTVIARLQYEKTPKIKRRKFDGTQPLKLLQGWLIHWQDKTRRKGR